ncbi:MAG: aldose 1-epimerase [Devosia sp.]
MTIGSGKVQAEIVPKMGAGLARFDYDGQPLFRPWDGSRDPFALASILLVPWSNRVSGGGFTFEGIFHPLVPNRPGVDYPIHGNGFSSSWAVGGIWSDAIELALASSGPGPFRYDARVRYSVSETGLEMALTVTNRAGRSLPFGLGLHPWLVRTPRTSLAADFPRVWLETADHLPDRLVEIAEVPQWDFHAARSLPGTWINNAFPGWNGKAVVSWPERGLSMAVEASEDLSCAIVFSPHKDADFFCLEPVTHPVDAFNLAGGSEAGGLRILAPGHSMTVWCRFSLLI